MAAQGSVENVLQASMLEHVFKIPCQIRRDDVTHNLRVDFYPPNELEARRQPEIVQFPQPNTSDRRDYS